MSLAGWAAIEHPIDQVKFIIWNRTGPNQPVDGDQVATGTLAAPPGVDDPDYTPVDFFLHKLFPVPFNLAGGDYYLTVFGDRADGTAPANLSWLTNADNGINLVGPLGPPGLPWTWRSEAFPAPGFQIYTNEAILQAPGLAPNDVYNTSFTIYGDLVPGPGGLALLGLGFTTARRRRRSMLRPA